jgi:hypothetical protein
MERGMKPVTTALIDYLNAVIGYFDGEIIFADAFVFAFRGATPRYNHLDK